MNKAVEISDEMTRYVLESSDDLGPVAHRIIAETRAMPEWSMQISPDEAVLLRAMVRLVKPLRIVEVGTFTGLSSLVMAGALPDGGRITCLDISERFTAIARQAWEDAGVADRVDLVIGPALESLAAMAGPIDMAFVDADKGNYQAYVEALVPLLRKGGMLIVDNTLWRQKVYGDNQEPDTKALRSFNAWLVQQPDLDVDMLAMADGVTVAVKR